MTQKAYVTNDYLSDIASAIRYKNGQSSSTYLPFEMASAIRDIHTGLELVTQEQMNALSIASGSYSNIGNYAFVDCWSLASVSFPVCTSIGGSAFYGCSSLISVSFPVCTYIGPAAFYSCTSLTSISFPACIIIDDWAFGYCRSLASVNFPVCTVVGGSAFTGCRSLSSVSFPACEFIGPYAFVYCSSLTSVKIGTSNCVLGTINTFYSTPMSNSSYLGYFGSIYVPSAYVNTYKTSTNWSFYSSRIVGY